VSRPGAVLGAHLPPFDRDRPILDDLARQVVRVVDLVGDLDTETRGTGGHGERLAGLEARVTAMEQSTRAQAGSFGRLLGLAELVVADVFARRALVTIALVLVLGGGGVTAVLAYLSPISGAPANALTP